MKRLLIWLQRYLRSHARDVEGMGMVEESRTGVLKALITHVALGWLGLQWYAV